jgi:hypothetical protein
MVSELSMYSMLLNVFAYDLREYGVPKTGKFV